MKTPDQIDIGSFRWLLHAGLVCLASQPDKLIEKFETKHEPETGTKPHVIHDPVTISKHAENKMKRFVKKRLDIGYTVKDIYEFMIAAGIVPRDIKGKLLSFSAIQDMAEQIKKEMKNAA